MKGVLQRLRDTGSQTEGQMVVYDAQGRAVWRCVMLEPPWKGNRRKVSCIPAGTYKVVKFHSRANGNCFHILDVPGRDMIEIHRANFVYQLLGCMAPGLGWADLDKNGNRDVTNSGKALDKLLELMPDEWELEVKAVPVGK